ncbi:MAG TPA: hypothetical protein VFY11_04205 [Nocardioidaceae bacterium]|nr:hypothetical protein [Nocardioidaceae bacterium]
MRLSRLLTSLLTLTLLTGPAALVAAPAASAAETYPTEVVIELDRKKVRYDDTFGIQGQVLATLADGQKYYVEYAEVQLQRMFPGKSWVGIDDTVAGADGVFDFYSVVGKQNASYRVTYQGETYTTEAGEATLSGSTSAAQKLLVARDIEIGSRETATQMFFTGKVAPSYKKKVVQVQVRKCAKCGWKFFKKVRTNNRSRFSLSVPVPRTGDWDYRAKTPESKAFIASISDRYLSVYMF